MKRTLLLLYTGLLSVTTYAQQGTIEYQTTISGGPQPMTSNSTMSFSNGNIRIEASIPIPGAAKPMKQTMLMLANKPNTVYMLNDASQTYTESSTEKPAKTDPIKPTVKIIGKEKIQGLNCTHALVNMGKMTMDVWTTKDIAGYEKMLSYWKTARNMGGDDLYNELKKSGADGFFVRLKNSSVSGGMTMELVSYNPKPVSAALFEIPKGYKKGASFDPEKMKNMSPAERQKLMQEMMKQYGQKQ